MYKRAFTLCFLLNLFLTFNIFSQYNKQLSSGVAPWLPGTTNIIPNPAAYYYNATTTGFAYYSTSTTASQLFRFQVGTPGTTTLIGSVKPYFLGNGDFANPTGIWKFYVQEQIASPYTIFEVDTATGTLTSVGAPLNLKSGHMPIDMEWDHTTNTMYMVSANSSLTETQFYSMYWPTKTLTWIGSPVTSPAAIIAGGFNANGTYFGIDMSSDALWKINKNTGIWTQVGLLGYTVNYGQDAGFDRTNFSKMLWSACGGTVGLYEVDTATGAINLIGAYPSYTQVLATGFVGASGPQISHTPLPNTNNLAGPYVVNATITPAGSAIAASKVFWSRNNVSITDSVNMTNTSGNDWTGNIPGNGSPATYKYYIWTKDALNRVSTAPINAPVSLYTFLAYAVDTIKPVITHTPLTDIAKYFWPCSVTSTVTDNLGIDSVWVRWRKNNTAFKQFKLLNPSSNTYTALFNSLNSDVNINDTIYYRIIAQDNSTSHNRDSTALFNFRIIFSPNICLGNGTVQMGSSSGPFNTYWYGNRTQMLYTAAEIAANGGAAGNVTRIGFNVAVVGGQVMNGFNINLQNTNLTTLTGFVTTSWTNAYTGTYTVPATGWQYIDLQSAFYWDGVSNILVEVCFGNTSYSTATAVLGTTMAGMEYSEYHDISTACTTFIAPGAQTSRANICFLIPIISGSNSNIGKIPSNYKLSQNYPNPFNPVTRICFDIPKQGLVTLKIYDMLGREVKELVNDVKAPGSYSVDFNASGFATGVYIYRIESNGFSDVKRMILLK
jgi:hypothetical protein